MDSEPGKDGSTHPGDLDAASEDSGTEEAEHLTCPAPLALPPTSGCDGLMLTDETSIESASDSIASTAGPLDASAVRITNGQSIDLKNEGCLQLGKDGSDFSISMWLKATGGSQIIGTTSQYSRAQGFILATALRTDGDLELVVSSAAVAGTMAGVTSAPFKAATWVHVALRYDNNAGSATFTIDVNLNQRSGEASPNVYNDKLRIGDEGWGDIATFEVSDMLGYGRLLSDRELKALFLHKSQALGVSESELSLALERLQAHVEGKASLAPAALAAEASRFVASATLLDTAPILMKKAFALIRHYETAQGPLFMSDATKKGITRVAAAADGLASARAMVAVQQTVLEQAFTPENVRHCRVELDGQRFLTADYFPGRAEPPSDPTTSYEVTISAKAPAYWGRPVAFATEPIRRPTGLYLSAGSMGKVTVPAAMVNAGYSVLVGAHTADHSNKSTLKRLDRVSRTFPITEAVTHIANPLGGGVYILVPYLADLGLVNVSVSGVIEAPFFSLRSFDQTTAEQWQKRRTAPGPWADFETDKFMMQVPSSWIYASGDPTKLLQDWDKAMDGVSELLGYPPEKRNRTVLYQQVDVQMRHNVFGIGYPQANNTYDPHATNEDGNRKHWLLTDPTHSDVDYHELGHAQLMSMFRGETEAIVNFPHAYVQHAKFGLNFDLAFRESFGPSYGALGPSPDDAAINWMVSENFRSRKEMDYSNTTKNQFRYQQRGYAKYADLYRLYGWETLHRFFRQEHLDYMAKVPNDGLDPVDSRILRLSVAAGSDVTPLIHFWGIHPVNPAGLKQKLTALGLGPSQALRAHLMHYKSIAPKNNTEFNQHFERVYPGRPAGDHPDYGPGWYTVWRDTFNETHAGQIQAAIDAVIASYF